MSQDIDSSKSNMVSAYLAQIRNTPLITLEQEEALGAAIRAGRRAELQLKELESSPEGDVHPQIKVCKDAIRAGDQAKRQLVEYHLRLAAYLAHKYRRQSIAMVDLIQEANIGLIRAVDNWDCDPTPEYRFSALAGAYITYQLKKCCNRFSMIHITDRMLRAIKKVTVVTKAISLETGATPSAEAIANELNIAVDITEEIMEAVQLAETPASLDAPVGEDKEYTLATYVPDPSVCDPAEIVTASILQEKVEHVLNTLEPDEEGVVRLRFGFEDGAVHSIEDVATLQNRDVEDVRLLETRALRKLRHPSRSRLLVGFLDQ